MSVCGLGNRLCCVRYYPVFMDLRGRSCIVIGGDQAAEARVQALLEAGARVTVCSPEATAGLVARAETHEIVHHARAYRPGDLRGAALAFAVTDDESLGAAVAAEAEREGVWVNVMDKPRYCSVIAPAVVHRGPVSVAVSTGGASPAIAKRVRQEIERTIGSEYGVAATILGELRSLVIAREPDPSVRARLFEALVDSGLLEALRTHNEMTVDAILAELVGTDASLALLGLSPLPNDDGSPTP